jgi:hypothetical protein
MRVFLVDGIRRSGGEQDVSGHEHGVDSDGHAF